ncbi:MAG: hypothetical protein QM776_09655 [Rhodocyclaceae bacterium]
MYKLGIPAGTEWVEHIHPASYQLQAIEGGTRLFAGVPGGEPAIFRQLVASLTPPFFLLYILHTPRGEGEPGRYQSPAIDIDTFNGFMDEFGSFLSKDARFDIWAHSPAENATVVWDRHNEVFGYGPLPRFELVLKGLGFSEGGGASVVAHQHCYHEAFDAQAARLLTTFDWSRSPLQEQDEQ